jgi:7-carboxy-7-deazaguanine synthase
MSALVVNEIFHSIQGESSHAGRPCIFIRLTYCNLRCTYCDTAYAFEEGFSMSIDEILDRVKSFACPLVEVTGGEPLVQEGVYGLLSALCHLGYEVLLETGGSIDIGQVDARVRRIVDFKCPSSGMAKKNYWPNIGHLKPGDEVKFVIGNREDFDWTVSVIREHRLEERIPVLLSPVFGTMEPAILAGWILEERLRVRMQLQMHKYVWEPAMRGV